MSAAEVERFYSDVNGDHAMRNQLKQRSATAAGIVAFAAERGYVFNVDDVKEHAKATGAAALDEAQLDSVAGGIETPRDPQTGLSVG